MRGVSSDENAVVHASDESTVVRARFNRVVAAAPRGALGGGTAAVPVDARHSREDTVESTVGRPASGGTDGGTSGGGEAGPGWGGAFDPGRRGVRALAAFAAVVVAGAALFAWWSRPRTEPVQVRTQVTASPAVAGPASSAPDEVVVAVAGRVRHPGLVRLPAGARVADAIAAAGGVLPGTDLAFLNQARRVSDGELIAVGVTPPPGADPAGPVGGAPPTGPVNLNTATVGQLDTLPGVGPVLAQRIIDYRKAHGGFTSVSQLRDVDGIGAARYDELKDLVTV